MARPYTEAESDVLKAEYLKEFKSNGGFSRSAAKTLDIPYQTAHYWMTHDPEFKMHCDEVRELVLDRAEQELFWRATNMRERDTPLIFFLKTKGKERGYVERVENINTTPEQLDYRANQMDVDMVAKIEAEAIRKYQESLKANETTNE